MPHVVFIAPHFLENTNRYVRAFAALDGVTLSVISRDAATSIPPALEERIAGHYRVHDVENGEQLATACAAIQKSVGRIDRLTGALEQLQLPMAQAREAVGIPGMNVATAQRFRNKDAMKAALRAAGVPVAKSTLVSTPAELRRFIDQVGFPIVVKPQAGLGARATQRVENEAELAALSVIGLEPSPTRPLQAEEFIRAREHTCETVSIHGKSVWRSGTRYFPSPLEVLETPWIQYCVLLPRESKPTWDAFAPTNEAALQALYGRDAQVSGTAISHMEWFLREDGSMLVNEVGARPPGVQIMPLMSLTHGVDMIEKWAELIAFDRFAPLERTSAAGAAFFRGQGNGERVVQVDGLQRAIERAGATLVEMRTPKVGQKRAPGYEGEGWAIVHAPETETVKRALLEMVQAVQIRYG